MSGGTRASAAGAMLDPAFAWRGGQLVTERGAARTRAFAVGGQDRPGVSVGSSEHLGLPRVHPSLRDVDVFLGWFGGASRAVQGVSLATSAITKVPGVAAGLRALTARAIKGSTGGPDAAARAQSGSVILAEARSPAGDVLASVRVEGVNGYDFTARMLAWTGETVAAGGLQGTGALGPVDGFGLDVLERGVAEAGLARVA